MSPRAPREGEVDGLPLAWRPIETASYGAGFGLYVLADPDAALEQLDPAAYALTDDRMPYFGTCWPAGESLAAALLDGPPLDGLPTLDLGCGAAPAGLAAAIRGAAVSFLDWEPRSLDLVRRSARRLAIEPVALIESDWRAPRPEGPWERVLGADVLYEPRNIAGIVGFLERSLSSGGEGWIADPGRDGQEAFLDALPAAGLGLVGWERLEPRPHGVEVTLFRVGRTTDVGTPPNGD